MKEYLAYWGLESIPFSLSPEPDMLFLSKQHCECLLRLKYAFYSEKGGALLISENAGAGKTSIIYRLIKELHKELNKKIKVALLSHPNLTPNQLIQEICRQLGVANPSRSRYENLNQLRDKLISLREEEVRCLIIVDEGQLLVRHADTLQELRILLNFCLEGKFLLTFLLAGQKKLEETIRSIPEFWQRLPVRFFLDNLDRSDTYGLILHRLKQAGYKGGGMLFEDDAINFIHRNSGGCPRVICSLCDLSLLIGYTMRKKSLDINVIQQAQNDMDRSERGIHYYKFLQETQKTGHIDEN